MWPPFAVSRKAVSSMGSTTLGTARHLQRTAARRQWALGTDRAMGIVRAVSGHWPSVDTLSPWGSGRSVVSCDELTL
jgi:hypothetical protein